MKINLAKSAGFCFGVRRAIGIAFETARGNKKVYMLGDIVHNEEVVKKISEAGIRKIKRLKKEKNKILLIRAHGTARHIYRQARLKGWRIVDATCPMVKEIHKIASNMEKKGYKIIIIGDKRHDEVYGISGQLKNKALIIENPDKIPLKTLKKYRKACIVTQSTQNLDQVLKIVEFIRPYLEKLKFFNTICMPTRLKQAEIKFMPKKNDVMIIIGSKQSANTRRLYEISKALNKRSYWVRSKKQIRPEWFKGAKSIGVTAGASTPDFTTKQIIGYIKRLA